MVARLTRHATKLVVFALLLVALGGWLHTHKHKKALHEHLDSTLTNLNTAHAEKGAREAVMRVLRMLASLRGGGCSATRADACCTLQTPGRRQRPHLPLHPPDMQARSNASSRSASSRCARRTRSFSSCVPGWTA